MTNKIKRLISILLVTVLFLLTIQPAFATGNKRKIDDYSIEELLNLSVQEQENLGFYVLAEVPMRIPVNMESSLYKGQWIGLLYEWNYRRYWPGFNKKCFRNGLLHELFR